MATIMHTKSAYKADKKERKIGFIGSKVWAQYLSYADRQYPDRVFWLVKTIIIIPCVYMTLSLVAMEAITSNYLWFIGLSMLVFFYNITIHIAGLKSRYYVISFHITTLFFVLVPLITFLLSK